MTIRDLVNRIEAEQSGINLRDIILYVNDFSITNPKFAEAKASSKSRIVQIKKLSGEQGWYLDFPSDLTTLHRMTIDGVVYERNDLKIEGRKVFFAEEIKLQQEKSDITQYPIGELVYDVEGSIVVKFEGIFSGGAIVLTDTFDTELPYPDKFLLAIVCYVLKCYYLRQRNGASLAQYYAEEYKEQFKRAVRRSDAVLEDRSKSSMWEVF